MTPATDQATPEPIPPDADPEVEELDEDPPQWVQQSSLSEVLLWRLGLPLDRQRIEREHQHAEHGVDLAPPITTRKVGDAIAQLSLQLIRGEIDAATAKTSLYALQTLLTALRLQILEAKKPKDTTKKKMRKSARRRKQIAKSKR